MIGPGLALNKYSINVRKKKTTLFLLAVCSISASLDMLPFSSIDKLPEDVYFQMLAPCLPALPFLLTFVLTVEVNPDTAIFSCPQRLL